jgi:hypothetical protein
MPLTGKYKVKKNKCGSKIRQAFYISMENRVCVKTVTGVAF